VRGQIKEPRRARQVSGQAPIYHLYSPGVAGALSGISHFRPAQATGDFMELPVV
jgi:hypothetical protein